MHAVACPGCGLEMPTAGPHAPNHRYLHCSAECWGVFTEVLAAEYGDVSVFAAAHQLSVDAYAAQHAGGHHPDKSLTIHLLGLFLALEAGRRPVTIPAMLQQVATATHAWPPLTIPTTTWQVTVLDIALTSGAEQHIELARRWAEEVWEAWSHEHERIRLLADRIT